VNLRATAEVVESNIPYSQTKEYRREYMRKRRANPEFRAKEYARDKVLSDTPQRRQQHASQAKVRNRERKLMGIEYLGGKCQRCGGEFHPAVFEFHHKNPAEKEYSPSHALQQSWENFKMELDKCELLCANCHRMTHHDWETGV
jgi:hypothetical protein